MADQVQPKVLNVRQTTRFTPAGQTVNDYQVTFQVGNDGPFTKTFAEADFTKENVTKALDAFAQTLTELPRG